MVNVPAVGFACSARPMRLDVTTSFPPRAAIASAMASMALEEVGGPQVASSASDD